MKLRLIALILALTAVSWAQTATPTPQQSTVPAEAKACPCCDKQASTETKDAHACCAHHAMAAADGKEPASSCMRKDKDKAGCCGGKDAMSCKHSSDDKTAAACCGSEKCGKDGAKGCCAGKKDEKAAGSCCGAGHCAEHMAGHAAPESGN